MSRLFPHAAYAEDQPYSFTILTTHVLYRGFQSGALLGGTYRGVRGLLARRSAAAASSSASSSAAATSARTAILPSVVRASATGGAVGTVLMVVALASRMRGREEIEWKDRSWRLLANDGQVETDDWSAVGTLVGGVAAASVGSLSGLGLVTRVAGGAGIGSLVGVAGYMGWRYGVYGGRREASMVSSTS